MAPFTKRRVGEFLHEIKGQLPTMGGRAWSFRCQSEGDRSGELIRTWVQSLLSDLVVFSREPLGVTITSVQHPFDFGATLPGRVELRQCQTSVTDADFEVQVLVERKEVIPDDASV